MDFQEVGISLERRKKLTMEVKQIHTSIVNMREELSRAFPERSTNSEMPFWQLEKACIYFQEVKSFAEEKLFGERPGPGKERSHVKKIWRTTMSTAGPVR